MFQTGFQNIPHQSSTISMDDQLDTTINFPYQANEGDFFKATKNFT